MRMIGRCRLRPRIAIKRLITATAIRIIQIMFPNRFHPGSKSISRFSLTNVAAYLLNLVDARIIDDKNVIQMARCVYTVEYCDSGSQAIKIHEGRACHFVFIYLHSLIRSRFRNRINSWFSGIFFQSAQPQMRDEPPVNFPASQN